MRLAFSTYAALGLGCLSLIAGACAEGTPVGAGDGAGNSGTGNSGSGGAAGGAGGMSTGTGTTTSTGSATGSGTGTGTGMGGMGGMPIVGCGDAVLSMEPLCQTCIEGACCDEMKACHSTTDCGALVACLNACAVGDAACQQACVNATPDGLMPLQTLVNCYEPACEVDCGTFDVCDSGLTTNDIACDNCLSNTCCPQFNACINDTTCNNCLQNGGAGCDTNALLSSYQSCSDLSCLDECVSGGICDSGITFNDMTCDTCVGQFCCSNFESCIQFSGGVQQCINCLNDAAQCPNANASTAATNALTCTTNSCSVQCGF